MLKQKIITLALSLCFILPTYATDDNQSSVDLSETEDLFSSPANNTPSKATDPSSVIVRVNGENITLGEIQQEMLAQLQQFRGQIPPDQLPQIEQRLFEDVKNRIINNKLITAAINEEGIIPDSDKVADALENMQKNLPEGTDLAGVLEEQGLSITNVENEIRHQLSVAQLGELKTSHIGDATEDQAQEYYHNNPEAFKTPEEVTASHILMRQEDEAGEDSVNIQEKLETLRSRIIKGEISFEEAATAHSSCPSSKSGGSLGTFRKGQMVPQFEVAAFTQEIDEIGDIIETDFGFHIIKVSNHTDERTISFEESKDKIIQYLTMTSKQEAFANYIKGLRDSATIENL